MRRKIYTLVARGSALLSMIMGCFLDSDGWMPLILMTAFFVISIISVALVNLEAARGR